MSLARPRERPRQGSELSASLTPTPRPSLQIRDLCSPATLCRRASLIFYLIELQKSGLGTRSYPYPAMSVAKSSTQI